MGTFWGVNYQISKIEDEGEVREREAWFIGVSFAGSAK